MKAAIKRGFTIVELLVVITIIGILMAMLFPAISTARIAARRAQCTSRQRQLGTGIMDYALVKDRFPGWKLKLQPDSNSGSSTSFEVNWVVRILPHIDATDVYEFIKNHPTSLTKDPLDPATPQNERLPRVEALICPANPPPSKKAPALAYVANVGIPEGETHTHKWTGIFFDHTKLPAERVRIGPSFLVGADGASNTLLVSETVHMRYWNNQGTNLSEQGVGLMWVANQDASGDTDNYEDWSPNVVSQRDSQNEIDHMLPSSMHPGVYIMTFCDGHTKAINENIRFRVYHYLMTSNGQEFYEKEKQGPLSAHMLEP